MKVAVLKNEYIEKRINITRLETIEMALDEVIEQGVGCPAVLHMPGINWTRKVRESETEKDTRVGAIEFFDQNGARHEVEKGILFYTSFAELVEFVAERIDPAGKGKFSEVARWARGFDGVLHKERIESVMDKGSRRHRLRSPFSRRVDLPLENISDKESWDYVPLMTPNGPAWAWPLQERPLDYILLAIKDRRDLEGHRVPFYKIIKPMKSVRPDPDESTAMDFMLYDGERHTWLRNIDEAPPALLDEIDEHGAMYYMSDFDILPMDHLVPVCAVRIPPREQMQAHIEESAATIHDAQPPQGALNNPTLVFDSHYPIPLPAGTPVVDDPRAALWLLSKTVRGTYLPRKRPSMFPLKKVPQQETFQVLTRPRRMTS